MRPENAHKLMGFYMEVLSIMGEVLSISLWDFIWRF